MISYIKEETRYCLKQMKSVKDVPRDLDQAPAMKVIQTPFHIDENALPENHHEKPPVRTRGRTEYIDSPNEPKP